MESKCRACEKPIDYGTIDSSIVCGDCGAITEMSPVAAIREQTQQQAKDAAAGRAVQREGLGLQMRQRMMDNNAASDKDWQETMIAIDAFRQGGEGKQPMLCVEHGGSPAVNDGKGRDCPKCRISDAEEGDSIRAAI